MRVRMGRRPIDQNGHLQPPACARYVAAGKPKIVAEPKEAWIAHIARPRLS
jgi:hypothetical protein